MACGSVPNSVWGKTTPCCMGSLLVRSVMVSGWWAQTVACVGPSGTRRLHGVHAHGIRHAFQPVEELRAARIRAPQNEARDPLGMTARIGEGGGSGIDGAD